ncbi:MAG: DNA polymerase I [Paludibacteraceae bacterium]|nr:DNA polymerase I [Paludibacteraceae bacterium]
MKLLLIDAYAMIYRAYYAFIRTPRINSKGENTSAIFGFVVTLDDLLRKINPTHIAVAFDPHGPTFRHEAYPPYKAQREETPEDIRRAVPVIKQLLDAMRIVRLECAGFEADDVIGTVAQQAEQQGFEVLMATPDKDYGQLVTDRVNMYRPRHTGGFEQMGPKEVCEKYGLSNQRQVIDLLALMGDASDNVPGCKGVGEKTAVGLLQQFGSIDNMLAHTDQIKGALRTKVETQREQIEFSRYLVTIRTDAPVTFNPAELIVRQPDKQQLADLYRELEFNSMLKKIGADNQESKVESQKSKAMSRPTAAPSKPVTAQLDLFAELESNQQSASIDTSVITPLPIGVPATNGSGVNLRERPGEGPSDISSRLCAYLLNPEQAYNPNQPPQWDKLKADPALWNLYNEVELPLVEVLRDMERTGVRFDVNILKQAEQQLSAELVELEQKIIAELSDMLAAKGEQLPPLQGRDGERLININSPKQIGDILFGQLQLDPKAKKGRNGNYSTSEEVLRALKPVAPVCGDILDYRELKKLISTYITTLPSYINPATGKIHTTYNQTVTATGRLSSSNPNMQNLPIRSERGQLIRRAVIADPGCKILSADYSQIELRLMAHFSQDEHLLYAFRNGQDIHAATAAKIFKVPIELVSKEQRRAAKTANFGILYGISAFGLAQQLDCSRSEAKQLIDDYFAAFPKIRSFIEAQKEFAREHLYVETLFGRKRYLPDILSHNATVRAFAERNAVNAPVQGTAADIIKIAMVAIHRDLQALNNESAKIGGSQAQMIMQVHDELNFNVPVAMVEQVRKIVVDNMQNAVHLSVPLIAECGVGDNWLEAH